MNIFAPSQRRGLRRGGGKKLIAVNGSLSERSFNIRNYSYFPLERGIIKESREQTDGGCCCCYYYYRY